MVRIPTNGIKECCAHINVKSKTLDGYNFQNNGFRKKFQTVSKHIIVKKHIF